jgi:hypothetical protein
MMMNQNMDEDELEYVGLIKDGIRYKEDIRTIQVSLKALISLGVDQPGPQRSRLLPQDHQGSRVPQAQAQ